MCFDSNFQFADVNTSTVMESRTSQHGLTVANCSQLIITKSDQSLTELGSLLFKSNILLITRYFIAM